MALSHAGQADIPSHHRLPDGYEDQQNEAQRIEARY